MINYRYSQKQFKLNLTNSLFLCRFLFDVTVFGMVQFKAVNNYMEPYTDPETDTRIGIQIRRNNGTSSRTIKRTPARVFELVEVYMEKIQSLTSH